MTEDILWPRFASPEDLVEIESIPLGERGLPQSTFEVLARSATLWPGRIAVHVLPDARRWDQPYSRTFAELLSDVTRTANLLRELGIERSDPVALISPNCHQLLTATLAAQVAGIAVPINGALSCDHVSQLLARTGARTLVAAGPDLDGDIWSLTQALVAAGRIDTVLLLRPTGPQKPCATPHIEDALVGFIDELAEKCDDASFLGAAPSGTDLAALFHTGGTTGLPKLAAHTHANEVADAWMVAAMTLLDQDSVVFAGLPLFHVNALVVTLLAPLLRGQRTVWAGPLGYRDAELLNNFWAIVESYRINAMSAVPTVYASLAGVAVHSDISSLKFALVGASALPVAVRRSFEGHTRIPLIEGYGLTEATCATARSFPDHPRPGSVGQRLPYQRVKTVQIDRDGTWHDSPTGEAGTLAISGPTVFPGYVIGRSDGVLHLDGTGKLIDGWLDTGDLGRVDGDGFVYLTGRAKDVIIRGGHNIDPAVIEDALLAHPEVTGAAAVGRPDIHAGEIPVAYVTLIPGAGATEEQLSTWATEEVGERAAAPKSVTILDALPTTAVGKPFKIPLRAAAAKTVIADALVGVPGVQHVDAIGADGVVEIVVGVTRSNSDDVRQILDRYAIAYQLDLTDDDR